MFLFTVTKPGLRQAGALALCAVCLCGTVAAAVHFSGDAVAAAAPVTATVLSLTRVTVFTILRVLLSRGVNTAAHGLLLESNTR